MIAAVKCVRENFRRPSGTRLDLPASPGAKGAGLLSIAPPGREIRRFFSTTSSKAGSYADSKALFIKFRALRRP